MANVRDGLTRNGEPMYPHEPSFQEQLEAAAKTTESAELRSEPTPRAQDLSLDSEEEIIRQVSAPAEMSRKISEGLTSESGQENPLTKATRAADEARRETNRVMGLPDEATLEDQDRALGGPERRAQEQLAPLKAHTLAAFQEAVESGDWEEMQNAGVALRSVDPDALIQQLKEMNENEIERRRELLDYYGSDEEFQDSYDEVMSEPTEASDLAEEVEAGFMTLKKALETDQANNERKQILMDRYGDEALENYEMYEMLRENVLEKSAEILGTNESAVRIHEHLSKAPSLLQQSPKDMERSLKFLEGIADEYLSVDAKEKRAEATQNFHNSIIQAPSTTVAEGLSNAQTEQNRLLAEQNALLRANEPAAPLDANRIAARAFDYAVDPPRRRRETAEEVQRSVAAPSSRSVEDGLTTNGKQTSSADMIARSRGFKDARDQREYELREEQARSRGILR